MAPPSAGRVGVLSLPPAEGQRTDGMGRGAEVTFHPRLRRTLSPRRREKMKNLSQRRQGAKSREAEVSCFLCDSAPWREGFLLFRSFLPAFHAGEGCRFEASVRAEMHLVQLVYQTSDYSISR